MIVPSSQSSQQRAGRCSPANALVGENQNFCDRVNFCFLSLPLPQNAITAIMKYVLVSGGVISGVGKVSKRILIARRDAVVD